MRESGGNAGDMHHGPPPNMAQSPPHNNFSVPPPPANQPPPNMAGQTCFILCLGTVLNSFLKLIILDLLQQMSVLLHNLVQPFIKS